MDERAIKLAAAILISEGEISLADIEVLPLVDDRHTATQIAETLRRRFKTEVEQRRISGATGAAGWEDVIVLRAPETSADLEASLRRVSRRRAPAAALS